MRRLHRAAVPLSLILLLMTARHATAQANGAFGVQKRADGASQAILLGVAQGIAALPPTTAQAFVYEFVPAFDTYKRSKLLGPTAFRTPLLIGEGKVALRAGASYFDLSGSFGPMLYQVYGVPGEPDVFTEFGLDVAASVGVVDLAATYGLTRWLDLSLNLPITIVDASASSSFLTPSTEADAPVADAPIGATRSPEQLAEELSAGSLIRRWGTVNQLGAAFNEGTAAGVGRIGLGGKALVLSKEPFTLALSLDMLFPSPSEAEYAGPDSFALQPRVIGAVAIDPKARITLDLGCDCDTEFAELRAFVWNVGAYYAFSSVTLDAGFGGAKYEQGIEWTPSVIHQPPGREIPVPIDLVALGDTRLGTNYANFLGGIKVRVSDSVVLDGAVSVPINDEGLRPEAQGMLAVEVYF